MQDYPWLGGVEKIITDFKKGNNWECRNSNGNSQQIIPRKICSWILKTCSKDSRET